MTARRSCELRPRNGFTLVELCVVTAMTGVVVSLLLPAVQQAREAARATTCRNNLRQIGIALQNYESSHASYPPGSLPIGGEGSWSVHARLLPFIDQGNIASRIQFDHEWTEPVNLAAGVQQFDIPLFRCGSDPSSALLCEADEGLVRPVSYGVNFGTWFIYDPRTREGGDGAFFPGRSSTAAGIGDGLSQTLALSEVKTFQPLFFNTADPGSTVPSAPAQFTAWAGAAAFELGPDRNDNGGHTEWCDGNVHDTGFTTVFTPNRIVSYLHSDGRTYDIDFNSRQEGSSPSQRTYAAITSRSYHPGLVHAAFFDGSVRAVQDGVSPEVWRALGTRAGGERVESE